MVYWIVFIVEIVLLFLFSREFLKSLYSLFLFVTKNKKITNYIIFFIFLPGIVVHEFSHALAAYVLRVYVGRMDFLPRLENSNLTLGSVEIGKTDVLRRTIIGVSPFFTGMFFIVVFPIFFLSQNSIWDISVFEIFIFLFFVFQITNTMFSSKKDIEGVGEFLLCLFFVLILLYVFGISAPFYFFERLLEEDVLQLVKTSNIVLLIPLLLNIVLHVFAKGVIRRM